MIQVFDGWDRGTKIKFSGVYLGPHILEIKTAIAYLDMADTAFQDGVRLPILSAYRTYEKQKELYELAKSTNKPAAKPGLSRHHTGTAIDFGDMPGFAAFARGERTPAYDFLEKFGKMWAFVRTVPTESWHWEYLP